MGTRSYFDVAENDYLFLKEDYERGRVGNIMCYSAQSICERYLKHIIDKNVTDVDTTVVLRTHSIKALRNFITSNLQDFKCDWHKVNQCDGYYFSTRYPGEDYFIVTSQDVTECWEAVEETRNSVMTYESNVLDDNRDIINADVLDELDAFDH